MYHKYNGDKVGKFSQNLKSIANAVHKLVNAFQISNCFTHITNNSTINISSVPSYFSALILASSLLASAPVKLSTYNVNHKTLHQNKFLQKTTCIPACVWNLPCIKSASCHIGHCNINMRGYKLCCYLKLILTSLKSGEFKKYL